MGHIEVAIIGKIFLVIIMVMPCIWAMTKNTFAQANIIASTPTGTTFCSLNPALSSIDMSNCTDAMIIPVGQTGQRPSSGINAMIRYNNSTDNIEAYSGSSWWNMTPVPTNVSSFTNDVPYATQSALTSGLGTKQPTITLGTSGQYMNGQLVATNFPTNMAKTFSVPSRSLNTAYQISTTLDTYAQYSINTACNATLISGQISTVTFEYADNSSMTTNLKVIDTATNSAGGVLNLATQGPSTVRGWIPAGKYAEMVTSTTGTACTVTIGSAQQEVSF